MFISLNGFGSQFKGPEGLKNENGLCFAGLLLIKTYNLILDKTQGKWKKTRNDKQIIKLPVS